MPFDMLPTYVCASDGDELFPQVAVFDGLPFAGFPAVFLPAFDPFGDAIDEVLTVSDDAQGALSGRLLEPSDGGLELHAVVGGMGISPAVFVVLCAINDDGGPASAPRVARTCAIRDNIY